MSETHFISINNNDNELVKDQFLKSTENNERTGAITPGGIKNVLNQVLRRRNWCELDSDSEDEDEVEDEDEDEQKSEETKQYSKKKNK